MTRSADPGFDPRIADWLENDPGRAPGQVMQVVAAALPSLPQRRPWRTFWRLYPVPRIALAAALAALLVIGAVAIFVRPAVGPGNPVVAALGAAFNSGVESDSVTASATPTAPASSSASPSPSADAHTISSANTGQNVRRGHLPHRRVRGAIQHDLAGGLVSRPTDAALLRSA